MTALHRKRIATAAAIFLVALIVLVPRPAHALDLIGVGEFALTGVLDLIYGLLTLIQNVIVTVIVKIGDLIQAVTNLKLSSGGPTVFTIWRVLRDFCNMAFIIALILMAFGTIFDSLDIEWLKPYSVNNRRVIAGFLIAAILLNFSLAIGQAIVGTSNEVTSIILKILPKNFGASVAGSLKVASTNVNSFATQPSKIVTVIDNVPTEDLSANQKLAVERLASPAAKQAFSRCLTDKQAQPSECYNKYILSDVLASGARRDAIEQAAGTGLVFSPTTAIGCLLSDCKLRGSLAGGGKDAGTLFRMITEKLYIIILSSVLMISFLVVLLFMLIRIPALWILLALSPLAWTSLAFPGMRAQGYDEWWKQFWAWNLFSPAYLFMLYFGMLFIQNISPAVASLATQDGTVPTVVGFIGNAFGYIMAGIVLIGGTALVLKASFLSGTVAGKWTGKITGALGAGGEYGALAPVGRFLGTTTGATAAYTGAVGGLGSVYEKYVTKPTARRQEEIEARYKARFGDSSAVEALMQKRIREAAKKNEEKGLSVQDMRADFGKAAPGSAEYFALGQALVKEGELKPDELKTFSQSVDEAKGLGTVGKNALRQQIARKIAEQVKDKKYKSPVEALQAFTALPETERVKFLRDLKKNDIVLYAQMASDPTVRTLIATGNLGATTGQDILAENLSKLDPESLGKAAEAAGQNGWTLGKDFDDRRDELLAEKGNYFKILDNAPPGQRAKLVADAQRLKAATEKKEADKGIALAEEGVKAQERLEAEREDRARSMAGRTPPTPPKP